MKRLRLLRSQVGLYAPWFAMGGLAVATALFALDSTRTMERASQAVIAENVASLRAVAELDLALFAQKGIVANYLLEPEPRWLDALREHRRDFARWLAKARSAAFAEPEREIVNRIEALYDEYNRGRDRVIALARESRTAEAVRIQLAEVAQATDALHEACQELLAVNERLMDVAERSNEQRLERLEFVVWGTVFAALGLGAFGGWRLSRAVARRLAQAEHFAALGRMAGIVAHEVRNPLTSLKLRLHTLAEEVGLSPSGREDLEVIRQEMHRLERLARNLLDFVRPPEPKRSVARVEEFAGRTVEVLRPEFEERKVRVETRFAEGLPPVFVDADQLRQVLLNILLNAAQAMPGGGSVTLSTRLARNRGNEAVEVSVSDTGPGFERDVRGKAFDPFVTTKGDGVGLGLTLARRIVEQNEGSIELVDGSGAGATIVIQLPAAGGEES